MTVCSKSPLAPETELGQGPCFRGSLPPDSFRGQAVSHLLGTAEWAVRSNSLSHPGELRLEGLQLALRQAKWSDGQDAVLYKSANDTQPYLHVPDSGNRALNLEWSARGLPSLAKFVSRYEFRMSPFPRSTSNYPKA